VPFAHRATTPTATPAATSAASPEDGVPGRAAAVAPVGGVAAAAAAGEDAAPGRRAGGAAAGRRAGPEVRDGPLPGAVERARGVRQEVERGCNT